MESIQHVRPVKPAAGYLGGKRFLASRLCKLIDREDHDGYAEPFVGMGGIFLRRSTRPKVEVINDINGEVINFFRVLQEHYPYFIDLLRFRVASRNEFERLKGVDPARLTDLQRAARFLYLQRLAFGGKVTGQHFGVDRSQGARFNIAKLEPMLADIHERLTGVTLEQLPFVDFNLGEVGVDREVRAQTGSHVVEEVDPDIAFRFPWYRVRPSRRLKGRA